MHARPGGGYQSLSFSALDEVTSRLAGHYRAAFKKQGELPNNIVALYANSSPEYLLSLWALMKAGFVPLCLSPRNSVEAVSHLATKAEAAVIVRGRESNLVSTTDELQTKGAVSYVVEVIKPEELQAIVDSVQAGDNKQLVGEPSAGLVPSDLESVALMLHSSGSTGAFPKLVRIPHRYIAMLLSISTFVKDPDDVTYALPPFYHAYGFFVACNTLSHGTTIVLPAVPSWPPTTDMLVDNFMEAKCNVLCLLPWVLETMEADAQQDPSIYELLASMRAVNFSAAALNERTGDALHARGVKLRNGYGSSEAGLVGSNHFNRTDDSCVHWNHIQIIPQVHHVLVPLGHKPNNYRVIIKKDNPSLALGQVNTPEGDYDMNDLLERVPCRPGRECYLIRGRLDDVIVHSTGEKTSPSPIEATIRARCAALKAAVVVGQDRFNTALLAELKPGVEPTAEVLDDVWRAVQAANQSAPQHSRIVRQMIRVMRHGEAGGIPLTDKGTVKRKHVEARFKAEIEQLYAAFAGEAGATAERRPAVGLTNREQIAEWLAQRLTQLYNNQFPSEKHAGMARDVSIFSQGFDSLLATQFYYQHLRPAFPDLKLPANLLYQCSDIDHLAARLADMLHGAPVSSAAAEGNTVRQAEELYAKYMSQLAHDHERGQHAAGPYRRPEAESVVLTGCTGGLGLFLLDQLLRSPKVKRVYALVRAGGRDSVKDKLSKALRGKLLDPALAEHEKLALWGCQLDKPKLGLTDDQWDELARRSTSVIHNAWLLNFEATPIEFEESCIKPSYELMTLCSSGSLKQYMFVSSIAGSLNSANADGVVQEKLHDDQRCASLMGYGQSKLLTERLATQYAARFHVPVTIARVGQIAGDTVNGTWNTSEHVSLMIKAIETLKAMPDHYMRVDALPIDVVAATMTALLTDVPPPDDRADNSGSPNTRVAHLVNPVALPWLDFLRVLQSPDLGLDFRIVDADEWVRRLEESSPDPVANPIKKLQGYFVDLYAAEKEARAKAQSGQAGPAGLEVKFETEHTTELVPSMHYNLDHDFWSKVLHHWRSIGFLHTPPTLGSQ